MSAEMLRRAASLMWEVAEKADAQPATQATVEGVWLNARFHMTWHPAVAFAVADWLEEVADHLDVDVSDRSLTNICPTAFEGLECSALGQALAVARAYLGESS